ncbi:immediate early response gene 5 protein [Spea bombifrons]|uniref:immediate early response gene 5 protein n=1 Tax=Spea bombifrons TaxID=233779 RepID=UPI00234929F5|nr:immediate early response gene 5 protein [Spea bombifrons]
MLREETEPACQPECCEPSPGLGFRLEAHRIVSISLGKIYHSRVQRGGIKLHKNLMVSLVLRSAQQVYLSQSSEELQQDYAVYQSPPTPQPCRGGDECSCPGLAAQEEESSTVREARTCSPAPCSCPPEEPAHSRGPPCCSCQSHAGCCTLPEPCRVCPESHSSNDYCQSRESDSSHQDPPNSCCRKRSGDSTADGPAMKRARREQREQEVPEPGEEAEEEMETENVANLISIFGTSFSGLLTKEAGSEENEAPGQEVQERDSAAPSGQGCSERAISPSITPWSTAIEAF